ncbi:MAG: stage 0 sporulation family protein [Clostridiales bacterium]|nr:stage 0 sporulation family protein [Clostridiales bacterium]
MAIVIGVQFKSTGKLYYFSPKDIIFEENDGVITETVRGVEFGKVAMANREVPESEIVAPLKEVIRKATPEDIKRHEENLSKRNYLMKIAIEKSNAHKLNMKVVDAEYTFDRQKVIIYFTAESRVDFRELVKDLASVFHIRIELRQIYERDDIKMRGALAACGRPCCCATFLQDFEKVSIKMAKIQGLSLNPQKLSGCCGKLMCCLKFENSYYQDMYKKMPKVNSVATTPDGEGVVINNDILRREVTLRFTMPDGEVEIKKYPLESINAKVKQSAEEISEEDLKLEEEK